eukprot:7865897-Lingulodinium_polyedra.AAC.1
MKCESVWPGKQGLALSELPSDQGGASMVQEQSGSTRFAISNTHAVAKVGAQGPHVPGEEGGAG